MRDELAARAAVANKSMQAYLREQLERMASKPSTEQWLKGAREDLCATRTRMPAENILRHIAEGRRRG
jgi:hypothetical protein